MIVCSANYDSWANSAMRDYLDSMISLNSTLSSDRPDRADESCDVRLTRSDTDVLLVLCSLFLPDSYDSIMTVAEMEILSLINYNYK